MRHNKANRYFHSKESNALVASSRSAVAGRSGRRECSIAKSVCRLLLVERPGTKPDWFGQMIEGTRGGRRSAIKRAKILLSMFIMESGQQESQLCGGLSDFIIATTNASLRDGGRIPVSHASYVARR